MRTSCDRDSVELVATVASFGASLSPPIAIDIDDIDIDVGNIVVVVVVVVVEGDRVCPPADLWRPGASSPLVVGIVDTDATTASSASVDDAAGDVDGTRASSSTMTCMDHVTCVRLSWSSSPSSLPPLPPR
jgi:hypothetical protein